MRHLRVGRFVALAVRMRADANLDLAVGRELHLGLLVAGHDRPAPGGKHGGAVRALLDEERKADADQPAVRLGMLLPLPDLVKPIAATARRRHSGWSPLSKCLPTTLSNGICSGLHHVAQPHLVRLEPGLARDGIHDGFDREADAGPRDAAIGQDRAFVGRHRGRAAAVGRENIRTRQQVGDLRRLQRG